MRLMMRLTAVGAIQSRQESMVVSGGWKYAASSLLSKPITCTRSGTAMPFAAKVNSAPNASWSLNATMPSKGMPESTMRCVMRAPEPMVQSWPTLGTSRVSNSTPWSAHASNMPRMRSCALPSTASRSSRICSGSVREPITARFVAPWSNRYCAARRASWTSSGVTWSALPCVDRAPTQTSG